MKLESLPRWFHRANWAGGALACIVVGIGPLVWVEPSVLALAWFFVWLCLAMGAANNARRGINSIRYRDRLRRTEVDPSGPDTTTTPE